MAKIKIVTDSSITIEPQVVEDLEITIVPLSVMVDGVVYSDADLKEGEFLHLMQSSKNLPKTSQPPVGVFAEIFETLGETADKIISIHMSHALSGTVEAARQGATLANVDVTVIDSSFTDQALKFQVVEAAKLAKEGADFDAILAAQRPALVQRPIPKYPSTSRDLALLVDLEQDQAGLAQLMKSNGGENLVSVELFDLFINLDLFRGKKSLAYRLIFQNPDKTLTDEDVQSAMDRIRTALETVSGLEIR